MAEIKKIKVKALWQGRVAIRDKQLNDMKRSGQDLIIACKDEKMTIKNEDLVKKVVATSDQPFFDRFSKEKHYLIYFDWKPDKDLQTKLL